jgi:hypothetical protein
MEDEMIESYCGLLCSKCEWKESTGCKGCIDLKGKVFWGDCPIAGCCIEKGISHCGECEHIPCELLSQFSHDEEHGDEGQRILQCKEWAGKG